MTDAVTLTAKTCLICGETMPEPAWLCLPRLMGEAPVNKPCSYSVEGDARGAERLRRAGEALVATMKDRAASTQAKDQSHGR